MYKLTHTPVSFLTLPLLATSKPTTLRLRLRMPSLPSTKL